MAERRDIRPLIRFQTDAWINEKLASLADQALNGVQYTSVSEGGKSHSEEQLVPIQDMIDAVTDVAHERGLNASNNTKPSRMAHARFE